MANNDDLILRGKALKDLRGIKDMLVAAGDPFLAGVMNRAIACIENQPSAAEYINTRVAELEAELAAAMNFVNDVKACETCKHHMAMPWRCKVAEYNCMDCDSDACKCVDCDSGSNWEWRHAHGQD